MHRSILFMLHVAALILVFPVTADHLEWEDENRSYDQARRAVADGRALSLPVMIEHLGRVAPGQIVAIEYEHEFERWVYEFKIIDAAGSLQTVHLDALTGELVQMADE